MRQLTHNHDMILTKTWVNQLVPGCANGMKGIMINERELFMSSYLSILVTHAYFLAPTGQEEQTDARGSLRDRDMPGDRESIRRIVLLDRVCLVGKLVLGEKYDVLLAAFEIDRLLISIWKDGKYALYASRNNKIRFSLYCKNSATEEHSLIRISSKLSVILGIIAFHHLKNY